jgi:cyclopropane fatty-acyl-phospholipid synthase-like methyltransferase
MPITMIQRARSATRYLLAKARNATLYARHDYLEAYARHTDLRVQQDPQAAIGGMWEQIGQLQFDFLLQQGLQPHHHMLDIGCGTLRGGRHFINHLEPGHYTGMDLSPKAIEAGRTLLRNENLEHKTPTLLASRNRDLKFHELAGRRFDFILAQSVFSHLRTEDIRECFQHIASVMNPGAAFYFTFNQADHNHRTGLKDFAYTYEHIEQLANSEGHTLTNLSEHYPHPRQQTMIRLQHTPSPQ